MSVASSAAPATSASSLGGPAADDDGLALWRVGLLGGLSLSDGQQTLTRLPSRAVTVLLARLAMAPARAHAREELVELLWPGAEPGVGRNRLRQALSTLKSILEPAGRVPAQPVVAADRVSVRVVAGSLSCDTVRFERLARSGQVDAARALYRGELLPGFYDDWVDEERLRLAGLHERLAQCPSSGPPSPSFAASPSPPAVPRTRVALPTYLTRLFGADEQSARLRGLVLGHRLVSLIGPGGSGKTRLAVETAHSLRQAAAWPSPATEAFEPFDLIAFVPLAACTTLAQAGDALSGALQLASAAGDPLQPLVDALAGRRALLVLDNFEQLVGHAEALVTRLLGALPMLHVVVTSRRALGIDGEHELALGALSLPPADGDIAQAAGNAAVALFVDRARAVRADFHFSARNGATLVELVRALDGMPLAIELAASRVRSIAPAELLARLRGSGKPRLDLLARAGAGDSRHASMQRVIEWSWEQLGADAARLLSALTVFPGGFSAAAAIALVGDEPFDAELLLDELVASSLVHSHSGIDESLRFGLFQPIREYAAARLDEATAWHWRSRLRAWALAWAGALPRTPPLGELRLELPNLMAALASADADGAAEDAIGLLLGLRRSVEDVEWPAEGLLHAQAAVARCADPVLRARASAVLGPMLFTAGQAEAAMRHVEAAVACDRLDDGQRARALHSLARVRWRSLRRAEGVLPLLDEADRLVAADGEPELHASLLALRAFVCNAHFRDHVAGERLHGQALAVWQELGNQHAINSGRYNLAVCAQNEGHHEASLRQLVPILASARELHDWRRLSQSLNVSGNAHSGLGAWPEALADYQECIRIAWKSMASFDLAHGLWNLPRALAHLRRPEHAIRIAAHATLLWRTRFGDLNAHDERYLVRVRRLVARQIGAARCAAEWRAGELLTLAQAVALALAPVDPA